MSDEKSPLRGLMKTGCAGAKKKCLTGISAKTTRSAGLYEMHHLFQWNRFSPARSAFSRKATALFSQLPSGSFFIRGIRDKASHVKSLLPQADENRLRRGEKEMPDRHFSENHPRCGWYRRKPLNFNS